MNVLLIDPKKTVRDLLIQHLFPQGLELIHAENILQAGPVLEHTEISILVIDSDPNPGQAYVFLSELARMITKPQRIVLSSDSRKEEIVKLVQTGIAGYLIKPFGEQQLVGKILSLAARAPGGAEKRSFHRVAPGAGEVIKVFFRLPNSGKLFPANLLNISAGGLALHCTSPDELPDQEMSVGNLVPTIQVKLQNKDITLQGEIRYRKGPVFAVCFRNCSEQDLFMVFYYIYERISETL